MIFRFFLSWLLLFCSEITFSATPRPHYLNSKEPFTSPTLNRTIIKTFKLDLKILLLTASGTNDPNFVLAKKSLQDIGLIFETVILTKNGTRLNSGSLSLTNPDGSGKYYGIITTSGELPYQRKDNIWESALTTNQWDELKNYEAKFNVRRVSLFTVPNEKIGMSLATAKLDDNTLKLASNANSYASGINLKAEFPLDKVWLFETKIKNESMASSFLIFKNSNLAATMVKFPDDRQQLHLFFEQSIYSMASIALSPVWIKWLTRNIFIGKRRIYLNPQVDDVFLATSMWSPSGSTNEYRISADDFQSYDNFQNLVLRPLTDNPNFKTEMAINGYGVNEYGTYANDLLFKKARQLIKDFNWISHTWSHLDLDPATYNETSQEITQNYQTAQYLGVWGTSNYSHNSMVTPKITGLFNSEAMRALANQRINFVVGDDSLPQFVNQTNPHLGLYTRSGIYIIPRHATEIYFDTSTPEELVSKYNYLHRKELKKELSFSQILKREEDRSVADLLSFNYAPWMFHQANMKKFKAKQAEDSLLSIWLKQITNGLRKYSTLPILNTKMNDLKDLYLNREKFENCQFRGQVNIQNFNIVRIYATSTKPCNVAMTGVQGSGLGITQENYGPDTTMILSLDGKMTRSVILNQAVSFN